MTLTAAGLERPRLDELKTTLDTSFTDVMGPMNTNADSVLGQTTGIQAAALDDAWEGLQDNYDAMYPSSAEGVSLDRAVSFIGLTRIPAAPSIVTAAVYGSEGTVIPANALAHADIQYFNTSDVIISSNSAIDANVTVGTVIDSTVYTVLLNGFGYTFNSGVGATATSILNGLAAAIVGFNKSVANDVLRISSTDGQTPFVFDVGANLVKASFGSPAIFAAVTSGKRELPIGALSFIDTVIFGWDSILNLIPGAGSRDVESDIELRARHANAPRVGGSATVKAIRSRLLQEVAGVSAVNVFENRSHLFDDAMPPHSFETIVQGGADQAVAQNIWENKPAGIETFGNVSLIVIDENGDGQEISFSRSVSKYGWVRVTVNATYPEEPLPSTTEQAIIDAVLAEGNSLTVGEDIITQRFIGPIYNNTSGLGLITVETALTDTPSGPPVYTTSNKSVARSEIATFDADRIGVVGL